MHLTDFDDNKICDLADKIRLLVVTALGEDEGGGLPPSPPIAQSARRQLFACAQLLAQEGK